MPLPSQIASQLRAVHFGGNWTSVNFRDTLIDLDWQVAIKKIDNMNSIATLICHATYYVAVLLKVLQGGPLDAKDEYSFQLPVIHSQEDWGQILATAWKNAEEAAALIEKIPESKLAEPFTDEKYGTYYRNMAGITEHLHYHLGQIVYLKKLISG